MAEAPRRGPGCGEPPAVTPTAAGSGCTPPRPSSEAGSRWPPSASSSAATPSNGCSRAARWSTTQLTGRGPWLLVIGGGILLLTVLGFILTWYFTRYQVAEGLRPGQHRLPVPAAAPGPAGPGAGHRHRPAATGQDLRARGAQVRGGRRRRVRGPPRLPAGRTRPGSSGPPSWPAPPGCVPHDPGRPDAPEAPVHGPVRAAVAPCRFAAA